MAWTVGIHGPQGTHPARHSGARTRESCSSSPAHAPLTMRAIALFSLAFAFALLSPMQAQAATWPLSTSELSFSCGYHAAYSAGGSSYTHSGMDVPGIAGGTVSTPLAGTVTFVGTVPNGDSRVGTASGTGQTMRAVSVKIADGRTITLMPLASVAVSRGDTLSEAETVGTLAATGDASTSATHLHMGLKSGGTYQDPMTLFGAVSTQSSSASTQSAAASAGVVSISSALAAAATSAAAEGTTASETSTAADDAVADSVVSTSVSAVTEPSTASVASGAAEGAADASGAAEGEWGTITSGGAVLSPSATAAPTLSQRLASFVSPLAAACTAQASALAGAIGALSVATGLPTALLSVVLAACAVGLLAAAGFAVARWVVPAVRRCTGAAKTALSAEGGR